MASQLLPMHLRIYKIFERHKQDTHFHSTNNDSSDDDSSNNEEMQSFLVRQQPLEFERVEDDSDEFERNHNLHKLDSRSNTSEYYDESNVNDNDYDNDSDNDNDGPFCTQYMKEKILLMVIIASGMVALFSYIVHSTGSSLEQKDGGGGGDGGKAGKALFPIAEIEHWCLDENKTSCNCQDPQTPKPRNEREGWSEAHLHNVREAHSIDTLDRQHDSQPDVVFLGDSITEGWRGTSYGIFNANKQENVPVFKSYFDRDSGANYTGLALGISGDKSPNLLWRIQNGEMPLKLKPKVWWILIGTNDFQKDDKEHCSAQVVFAGVQRVVEEVRTRLSSSSSQNNSNNNNNTTIVVNGLLPRSTETNNAKLYEDTEKKKYVMNAIRVVNARLKEYCEEVDGLEYFDVEDLFVVRGAGNDDDDDNDDDDGYSKKKKKSKEKKSDKEMDYIPKELMKDHLHPTALGYKLWGRRIVEKLHDILGY